MLTHSWDGQIPALKDFPRADRPNSTIVFWTFRVMVGLAMLMILLALLGLWLRRGGRLYRSRPFLRFALLMGPSGLVALLAGWFTTEIGRQPWIVYGADAHGRCGLAGQCLAARHQPGAVRRRVLRGLRRRHRVPAAPDRQGAGGRRGAAPGRRRAGAGAQSGAAAVRGPRCGTATVGTRS